MKLFLIIKEKGHYIEMVDFPPFRSPCKVDITNCDLQSIISYLHNQDITDYEIKSQKKKPANPLAGRARVINKKSIAENPDHYEKRIKELENTVHDLIEKQDGNNSKVTEQINNKLNKIERLLLQPSQKPKVVEKPLPFNEKKEFKQVEKKKPKKYEFRETNDMDNTFVPSINVDGMKMEGSGKETIKQDNTDINDSVDLLNRLTQSQE